jgi:arylsulfatase A-like enzyme
MDYDGGTLATYTRMVESMDEQIGRVLDTLEQTGQARDTLVLFTSDNGGERFSNTWPFTGKKEELLEGGLRVPAVIRWPGRIPKSVASDQVIIHMDWLPTFLAAAGGAPDPAYPSDGVDLLPTLTQAAAPFERALYWRYKANAQRAVRKGAFKALKIQDNTFLFDVVNDPLERANLKTRRPEVYASLTALWDAWNADMLPETAGSMTEAHEGALWADHIGARPINHSAVDAGGPWPNGRQSSR